MLSYMRSLDNKSACENSRKISHIFSSFYHNFPVNPSFFSSEHKNSLVKAAILSCKKGGIK
ncbi:hypothetical protein FJO98_09370 [Enterococcus sp. PF-2]|nr:hypothetical protein [Enterococcus casseliflavus]TPE04986.1 hypothetical protein FJP08_06655 [Enterococcus sp. PF-3]TPE26417.1 hypothetical protein FJO98_09370 [Enterococcus sp. PF-2]